MDGAKFLFPRALALSLLAMAGCGRPSTIVTAPPSSSQALAFVGVTVLGMTPDAVAERPDQTVVVQDGRIKAVGPRGAIAVPPGTVAPLRPALGVPAATVTVAVCVTATPSIVADTT